MAYENCRDGPNKNTAQARLEIPEKTATNSGQKGLD
jgi:hypothetical protein